MVEQPPHRLDLDALDGPGGPFRVRVGGRVATLRAARDLPWTHVVTGFVNWFVFVHRFVPAADRDHIGRLSYWQMQHLVTAYRRHQGLCETVDDDERLAASLSLFGAAIEYDLFERGVDLHTQWRARRWRTLLNLIDRLPRNTAYGEALTSDELIAERAARHADNEPDRPQRKMSDWSPDVEVLTAILDRLGELIQAVIAVGARVKPKPIPPAPRPVTAIERVRNRRRLDSHRSLVARVLPPRPD